MNINQDEYMKKILLIEDRQTRQQLFMDDTHMDLSDYSNILYNSTGEEYDNTFRELQDGICDLNQYSLIISHKSAFEDKNTMILDILKTHCKKSNTPLVLFSGGIGATYYNDEEYEVMEINSKLFYSKNLELFLEAFKRKDENILMLCYGEKWKINIALNILEKINLFIEKNNDDVKVYYPDFLLKIDMNKLMTLDVDFYKVKVENNRTTIDEIEKFKESIFEHVKEMADE